MIKFILVITNHVCFLANSMRERKETDFENKAFYLDLKD